jgi:3-hydroxyisobutyrate dehydrogenase-like beta-hydroxyacid dehydrogenase
MELMARVAFLGLGAMGMRMANSKNKATGAITCSGLLYVTVGDTTAQKQVDFKIERATDGKMSVSVNPFVF